MLIFVRAYMCKRKVTRDVMISYAKKFKEGIFLFGCFYIKLHAREHNQNLY